MAGPGHESDSGGGHNCLLNNYLQTSLINLPWSSNQANSSFGKMFHCHTEIAVIRLRLQQRRLTLCISSCSSWTSICGAKQLGFPTAPCICPSGVLIHWHIYYMCSGKFPSAPFLNLLCFIKNRMKYPLCMFTLKVCVCGYLKRPHWGVIHCRLFYGREKRKEKRRRKAFFSPPKKGICGFWHC